MNKTFLSYKYRNCTFCELWITYLAHLTQLICWFKENKNFCLWHVHNWKIKLGCVNRVLNLINVKTYSFYYYMCSSGNAFRIITSTHTYNICIFDLLSKNGFLRAMSYWKGSLNIDTYIWTWTKYKTGHITNMNNLRKSNTLEANTK